MKSLISIAIYGFVLIISLLILGGCDAYSYGETKATQEAAAATSAFQTSDAATWAAATLEFEPNLTPFISGFQTQTYTPTSTRLPTPTNTPTATSTDVRQSSSSAISLFYPLGPGRNGQAFGAVTLVDEGNTTKVIVDAKPTDPNVPQPVNIHTGSCTNVGPVKYPLSNIVNGRSISPVLATLAELKSGGYVINLQKSTKEPDVYVACVAIK